MSQISGYRRSLSHAKSITIDDVTMPKFGVASEKEEELAEVVSFKGNILGHYWTSSQTPIKNPYFNSLPLEILYRGY